MCTADGGVWAWFYMKSIPWRFRASGDRLSILEGATVRWADLAGHRVHIRRTAHPVPYSVWARNLDDATPNPLVVPKGAPTWPDYLVGAQQHQAQAGLEAPQTYIAVRLSTQKFDPDDLARILTESDVSEQKIVKARAALARVTSMVRKQGFRAKPVQSRVLGWLIHSSVGLGAPVSVASLAGPSNEWQTDDMDTFTQPVYAEAEPLAKTVKIQAMRDGKEYVRHVAVLSVGRMNDKLNTESPAFVPWLSATDRLPFSVEVAATFDVVPPEQMSGKATFFRQRAESIYEHHVKDHGETPKPSTLRGIRDAIRVEDEITTGDKETAVRVVGPIRFAVSAPDEATVLERVNVLTDEYAMNHKIALHHTYGQYPMYREFIPGEPTSAVGFQRVMPAYYAATAVPNAGTELGDKNGIYLGRAGNRAVYFDTHGGPRRNRSGMVLVAAEPGGGKSTLAGMLAEIEVRRGHKVVMFDPSGALAALCEMPALAAVSEHVPLSGAIPGTLNPYWLIPEPKFDQADSAKDHTTSLKEADKERREEMIDTLTSLLPEVKPTAERAITRAVNEVGGRYGTNPWRIVHKLEKSDSELERDLGSEFREAASMKGTSLVFPEDEHAPTVLVDNRSDKLLTVMTMLGLDSPPADTPRADWTPRERKAGMVLHLAARYAQRAMYADKLPKSIWSDETGIIAGGQSAFRSMLTRGSRDSRKTNTLFGILSQNPQDLLDLAPQITNLVGAAFFGTIKDPEAAAAALKILGVPEGHGYEKALRNLSSTDDGEDEESGHFLFRNWTDEVDEVYVDLAGWRDDLLDTLDTTPPQAVSDTFVEPSWTDELVLA